MSIHRRRLDRATAERLLSGGPTVASHGQDPLAHLLAAAAAPGRNHELAGEQVALAAFRTAHRVPPTQQRSHSMIKSALGKILTTKAVAVVAATTIGGVAVAAGTGNLPTSHGQGASSQSQQAETSETGPDTTKPADAKAKSHASAAPSPSMVGLCRAYSAGVATSHGKALDNPAFTALITTAGGKDKVAGWCTTLLAKQTAAQHKAGSPSEAASGHPDASEHPGAPTEHSGAPTAHATPTTTPTGHGGP